MSIKPKNSTFDLIFIGIFSILVFFGAFFVFSEFKKPDTSRQVSVRNLEDVINKKVNKRIQKLEGKKIFLKSKMKSASSFDKDYKPVEVTDESDSKYNLEIFEKSNLDQDSPNKRSVYDEVLEQVSIEDGNNTEQQEVLQEYKRELIEKARREGWEIELNDNLEITKQVKLK